MPLSSTPTLRGTDAQALLDDLKDTAPREVMKARLEANEKWLRELLRPK